MHSPGALNSHHGCTWPPLTSGRASLGNGKVWPSTRQRQARSTRQRQARSTRQRQARVPDSQTRDSRALMLVGKLDWSESQTSWMSCSSWNLICNAQYAHVATLRACAIPSCGKITQVHQVLRCLLPKLAKSLILPMCQSYLRIRENHKK